MTDLSNLQAASDSTDPEKLAELAFDHDQIIRAYVAENPHTPMDILINLAEDKTQVVKIYVLRNKNIPLELCLALMKSQDNVVRREASLTVLRRYKSGAIDLQPAQIVEIIKSCDKTADTLTTIEALESILKLRDKK